MMKKARIHDFADTLSHESHDPNTDSYTYIMSRALIVFEGAKNDLYSDFAKNIIKRNSLWNPSQQVAIVRAKWDQPISTVRQLLSFCTTKSLEDNKENILNYFTQCYDWLDLAVAIRIYESITHPECAYLVDSISYDRHYNSNRGKYSDGKSGEPYLTINMLDDLAPGDLDFFVGEYFDMIYTDDLPKPKRNEATPQLLRNIFVRNVHYLYDIKPTGLMYLIEDVFSEYEDGELTGTIPAEIENVFRNYNEQNVSNDFRKFNREIEQDWFREAINTFENDKTRYLDMYKNHYVSMMIHHNPPEAPMSSWPEIHMLDDPIYDFEDERLQRFELKFNSEKSLFSLKLVKIKNKK